MSAIRVEVTDLVTGSKEVVEIPLHEYFILTTGDCHVSYTQAHANGTHVLTVKGRRAARTPGPTKEDGSR